MGKRPAFEFYPADWIRDTQLQMASPASRGIWINLLCNMWWSPSRGSLTGTLEQLAKLALCTMPELEFFLSELESLQFGRVTFASRVTDGSKIVTLENRRMVREEKARISHASRQKKYRDKHRDAEVTSALPSTPNTPLSTTEKNLTGDSAPVRSKKPPNPAIKVVIDYWFEQYRQQFGSSPPVNGGKCGMVAKRLLAGRTLDEAKWLVAEHLRDPPQLYRDKGLYGLEHVLSSATTLLARRRPRPP